MLGRSGRTCAEGLSLMSRNGYEDLIKVGVGIQVAISHQILSPKLCIHFESAYSTSLVFDLTFMV